MSSIKTLMTLIMLAAVSIAGAQSVDYSRLEKRFVKTDLTAQDTAAFRETGEQKVRQLFDKGNFYNQNQSNLSNQAYVKQQIPDLFYVPPGDTLDVDALLLDIERAKQKQPRAIELSTKPADGYLGVTETVNCDPKFIFYLVLMQIPKQFGNEREPVWQVFLHQPEQREVKVKKAVKKSGRE